VMRVRPWERCLGDVEVVGKDLRVEDGLKWGDESVFFNFYVEILEGYWVIGKFSSMFYRQVLAKWVQNDRRNGR
jgi:hypothetical protein